MHVFIDDAVDEVRVSWVLADTADRHSVGAIAGNILRIDVGAIPFNRDAIITSGTKCQLLYRLHVVSYSPFDSPIVKRYVP